MPSPGSRFNFKAMRNALQDDDGTEDGPGGRFNLNAMAAALADGTEDGTIVFVKIVNNLRRKLEFILLMTEPDDEGVFNLVNYPKKNLFITNCKAVGKQYIGKLAQKIGTDLSLKKHKHVSFTMRTASKQDIIDIEDRMKIRKEYLNSLPPEALEMDSTDEEDDDDDDDDAADAQMGDGGQTKYDGGGRSRKVRRSRM